MTKVNTLLFMLTLALLIASTTHAARLRELCEVQGARNNELKGVGYIVGLAGTGDKSPLTVEAQQRMLDRLGIQVDNLKALTSKNSAIVMVTATLPPFIKEGTRIDVKVDALSDCESLEGGMLLETYLYGPGPSKTVYALAQGPVSVGGFNADASGGSTVRRNHVTAGRVPGGGVIEQEAPSTITDGRRIILTLNRPDFSAADTIQKGIQDVFGPKSAEALSPGSIRVNIPEEDQDNLVSFIAKLQDITVTTTQPARIVINERTGTVVVGGDVTIKPCQVAQGSITITVDRAQEVLPPLSFIDPNPIVVEDETLTVKEEELHLMPVEGTSAADVAQALNQLKVTPRDMISIFQALRSAGALEAELETM
jgi:flagellar P-ring protein FlgI